MTTIVTRAGKGTPLTHLEVDTNFTNLNTDKAEVSNPTFTGVVNLAAGTVAAPSLRFGDSGTGFYRPAVNQVGVSTNGVARLLINASGRLFLETNTFIGGGGLVIRNGSTTSQSALLFGPISGATGSLVNSALGDLSGSTPFYLNASEFNFNTDKVQITNLGAISASSFIPTSNTVPANGLYLPSANNVAISTNGTGRLFVDASGNVDIATAGATLTFGGWTNDRTVLQQRFDSQYFNRIAFDAAGRDVRIQSNSGDSTAKITLWTGATGTVSERLRITSTGTLNFVGAGTAGSTQAVSFNGSAPVNSLVVDASGNIGIGAAPDGQLSLLGANSNTPRFRIQHPSNDKDAAISAYFDGSGTYLFLGSNHYVNSAGSNAKFDATSGSSAWYLDGSGIGVFYNSSGSGSITERLRVRADGTFEIKGGGTAGTSPAVSVNPSASANSFVIDNSGRVGLGTSSPRAIIDIVGSNSSTSFSGAGVLGANRVYQNGLVGVVHNSDTTLGSFSGLQLVSSSSGNLSSIGLLNVPDGTASLLSSFVITQRSGLDTMSERLRIDSSGRVGIGTASPLNQLDVAGGISLSSGGANVIRILQNIAAGGYTGPGFYSQTSIGYGVASGGTHRWIGLDGNTEIMRLDGSGRLGVGTASPSNQLSIGSAGTSTISFDWTGDNAAKASYSVNHVSGEVRHFAFTNYFPTFYSNNIERARIDSSGRLLVGTSTARTNLFNSTITSRLQVEGTGVSDPIASIISSSSSGSVPATLVLGKQGSGTVGGNTIVASGDFIGGINFQGNDGSEFVQAASIYAIVDGTPGADSMPGRIVFSTATNASPSVLTERMRINSNGAVGTFTIDGVTGLNVSTAATAGTATIAAAVRYGATAVYGGTISFQIYSNGNVQNTNGSYTTISDAKLKENIVDASSQWDDLKAVQIRNWNFKAETGHETHRQIGPIAQELEQVCPGLVFETPDRDEEGNETGEVTKGVNQSVLYMKAVKALQEAMERIETLEAKVAALEGA